MRFVPLAVAALFSVCVALAPGGRAQAERLSEDGEAATANQVPDFGDPPNADKGAGGYVNPCTNEGYEYHVSERTGQVKNADDSSAISLDGDEVLTVATTSTPGTSMGWSFDVDEAFVIESVEWTTACAPDADAYPAAYEPGTTRRYWITRPTPGSLFPDLIAEVSAGLKAPEVIWPNVSREFGWIYVQVVNDIRMETVEPVRRSRSESNLAGSLTVWIEATPSVITFQSGDPDDGFTQCSYAQATASYRLEEATHCSYKYTHSSAGAGPHDAFTHRTSVSWEIAASHPLAINNPISWTQDSIQVAEIQAIEVAP